MAILWGRAPLTQPSKGRIPCYGSASYLAVICSIATFWLNSHFKKCHVYFIQAPRNCSFCQYHPVIHQRLIQAVLAYITQSCSRTPPTPLRGGGLSSRLSGTYRVAQSADSRILTMVLTGPRCKYMFIGPAIRSVLSFE
jgi:hypothetical protein